ncbi:MAG: TonB-dependent receptor [Bacteroidales bacterium]|nr:TonB-dependent receptor [Bacteroidales bacterium]
MKQAIKCLLCTLCAAFAMGVSAFAQVTTSSMNGSVTDNAGEPVVGVAVVATHVPSGTVYGGITNENGRYAINGMRSGGPYKVEVSCLGYQTVIYTDVTLQLGDSYALNARMNDDKEMLSEALVVGEAASKFAGEKTGAATNISSSQIESLPTVSRSIEDIASLSPYGGNGMSFGGSDGRSSNFTVDGANFNNNFGLNPGLPGGGSPISIDAIEEVQVVVAPFDVRQSNFIGGGMNAITKSGTNTFKGSAYVYHSNENMRGNKAGETEVSGARDKDRSTTYGFTLGGPIVKDKLFFFVNFEYSKVPTVVNRWRASEDGVGDKDAFISRTKIKDMETVRDFLAKNYGYDTGSFTDYPADESNMKILARIDWNINENHNLAVRYNYTLAKEWQATNGNSVNAGYRHKGYDRLSQYSMAFANSMYTQDHLVNSFSVDLNSRFGANLSNQLLVTFSKLDDMRGSPSAKFPHIDIMNGYTTDAEGNVTQDLTPYMTAGYELFTWNNGVHNNAITAKDDITYYAGNHKVTAGVSYDYQMADNSYMRNGTGYYRYRSLDDFLTGAAPETVAITYGYDGEQNPAARVRYHQIALYGQDEWNVSDRFKLTYGLRLESMIFDNQDLMTNNAIKELDYGGKHFDTGYWPTPKIQVSPRIGFNWDVFGDRSLKVRGGTGLFTGRIPLVFFTNMPTNSGMVQNLQYISTLYENGVVNAGKSDIKALEQFAKANGGMITDVDELVKKLNKIDPKKFPLTISPEDGVAPAEAAGVDPKFKMPQVWKTTLALDYQVPVSFPFTLSGEFTFNKTVNGIMLKNWNIKEQDNWKKFGGADDRYIYPDDYKYYAKNDAYILTNTNKGYGYIANVTMTMAPVEGLNIMAAYTHTASKEISGMPGSNATSAFIELPTVNGPNFATLANSQYVIPDRFIASLTYSDKSDNHFSIFYQGWRGGYAGSYVYDGDVNGDNVSADLMYIPANENEIKFSTTEDAKNFWAYVAQDKYLSSHKGQYAEANSVYTPWVHRFDFRYSHDFKIRTGRHTNTLQLNLDIKNAGNIFNPKWGVSRTWSQEANGGKILKLDKVENNVPVFKSNVGAGAQTWTYSTGIAQCWYAQIGIKYMFN